MTSNKPHAAQPSDEQEKLIRALGGQTKVSRLVNERLGCNITAEAVSMWIKRGIPYRYRGALVVAANEEGVSLPPDFFGIQRQSGA